MDYMSLFRKTVLNRVAVAQRNGTRVLVAEAVSHALFGRLYASLSSEVAAQLDDMQTEIHRRNVVWFRSMGKQYE